MIKKIITSIILTSFVLTGCGVNESGESIPQSSLGDQVTTTITFDSTTESQLSTATADNSISSNNIKSNIKFLCAWQENLYIDQGYIAPHYMIYYITDEGDSYSAVWETNDIEPTNAILHTDEFISIEELGYVSLEITEKANSVLAKISDKEIDSKESEQLDVSVPYVWWYGYYEANDSVNQLLIYQDGESKKRFDDDDDVTLLMNSLFNEPTFNDAHQIWNTTYGK